MYLRVTSLLTIVKKSFEKMKQDFVYTVFYFVDIKLVSLSSLPLTKCRFLYHL